MLELNICLLPSKEVGSKCIQTSRSIAGKHSRLFTLDHKNTLPHLSLYHFAIPNKNLSQVKKELKQLVGTTKPFTIHLNHFSQELGFIEIAAIKSKPLIALQNRILKIINPLRENTQRPGMEDLIKQPTDPKLKNYINRYGYPYCKSAFKPHITLTRLTDEKKAQEATKLLSIKASSFTTGVVGLGFIGPNGICPQIIERYRVKS